jgi:hypothetical protein
MSADTSIKAEWARILLGDPQFTAVFDELREELYTDIRNSGIGDSELRELCFHEISALDRIKAKLQGYLDNHKLTERRINI